MTFNKGVISVGSWGGDWIVGGEDELRRLIPEAVWGKEGSR